MSKEMEQNPDYWSGPVAQERKVNQWEPAESNDCDMVSSITKFYELLDIIRCENGERRE